MKIICPKECKERMSQGESIEIIDVRENYEYEQCNIGSIHIPMSEIIERNNELSSAGHLVIMCRTGKRAAAGGMVPADTSYGQWLARPENKTLKIETLGKEKARYFDRLTRKHGARDAMAKLVRNDGSELTLPDLRRRYGKLD